ncbi:hypothetical protein Q5752_004273 [Cryptotrichosporon argae]
MSQPSSSGRNGFSPSSPDPADPTVDDPLESSAMAHSTSSRSLSSDVKLVVPSIAIKSEFPSVRRNKGGKQVITAMVTVYVPQAPDRSRYPPARRSEATPTASSTDASSPQFPPSPRSASSYPEPAIMPSSARSQPTPTTSASFAHVVADLRNRVIDYKTSGLDTLGPLRLFDLLSVRKGQLVREFHVYLFQDAIICISEERKSGLRGIFSSSSSVRSGDSSSSKGGAVLKLKGRIYVRHIRQVVDTSVAGELSLTITMEDESMDSFILTFKDRGAHETWKQTVQRLIDEMRDPTALAHAMQSANKVAKLTGTAVPIPRIPASASSTSSRPFSPSHSNGGQPHHIISNSFGDLSSGQSTPASPTLKIDRPLQIATGGPGDLALHAPLAPVHTPLDLVLVLSLPAPSPSPSASLPLKIRLIRSSVQFVLACMGPRDRVSLVATELGPTGTVRKTPLLNATHVQSRARLEAFVETLGVGKIPRDEFEIGVSSDERRDVITAVNVALDVVLQRKAKNPLTGVVLISDTSDVIRRAQMDLVTARLDAANVPVHALGYGKSHDPSPLWMMSNHTHGTYTFVKEWYHLRDSLAGVLGGLMSIAMTNMKLHVSAQDNEFRVTKVSGTSQAVVAASGKNVDIELRELRHGERREILIELEIDNGAEEQRLSTDSSAESGATPDSGSHEQTSSLSAASMRKSPSVNTDRLRGINGLAALGGFDRMSINDGLRDVAYGDAIIDEVPVAEVDCAFHDPAVGKSAARLAHPVLLTLPILPPTAQPTSAPADPAIVRRRMELLASDMITRALLIASRKNYSQATRILRETKRIIESVANGMRGTLPPLPPSHAGTSIASGHTQHTQASTGKSRREVQTLLAIEGLVATVQDVDQLLDGLDVNKDMFERDHRNYAAQQAIILRAQRSWTTRTPTEMEYATRDVQYLIQLSGDSDDALGTGGRKLYQRLTDWLGADSDKPNLDTLGRFERVNTLRQIHSAQGTYFGTGYPDVDTELTYLYKDACSLRTAADKDAWDEDVRALTLELSGQWNSWLSREARGGGLTRRGIDTARAINDAWNHLASNRRADSKAADVHKELLAALDFEASQYAAAQKDIDSLEQDIDGLEQDIDNLELDIAALSEELEVMSWKARDAYQSGQADQYYHLVESIQAKEEKLKCMEEELESMEEELESMEEELSAVHDECGFGHNGSQYPIPFSSNATPLQDFSARSTEDVEKWLVSKIPITWQRHELDTDPSAALATTAKSRLLNADDPASSLAQLARLITTTPGLSLTQKTWESAIASISAQQAELTKGKHQSQLGQQQFGPLATALKERRAAVSAAESKLPDVLTDAAKKLRKAVLRATQDTLPPPESVGPEHEWQAHAHVQALEALDAVLADHNPREIVVRGYWGTESTTAMSTAQQDVDVVTNALSSLATGKAMEPIHQLLGTAAATRVAPIKPLKEYSTEWQCSFLLEGVKTLWLNDPAAARAWINSMHNQVNSHSTTSSTDGEQRQRQRLRSTRFQPRSTRFQPRSTRFQPWSTRFQPRSTRFQPRSTRFQPRSSSRPFDAHPHDQQTSYPHPRCPRQYQALSSGWQRPSSAIPPTVMIRNTTQGPVVVADTHAREGDYMVRTATDVADAYWQWCNVAVGAGVVRNRFLLANDQLHDIGVQQSTAPSTQSGMPPTPPNTPPTSYSLYPPPPSAQSAWQR